MRQGDGPACCLADEANTVREGRGTSPLKKKRQVVRPQVPGIDRPPRFQRGREADRFSPPPPFFPEKFPEGGLPWIPRMDEASPPDFPRQRGEPARDFHFRDLWEWEMEILPPDEWEALFDRDGEETGEGRKSAPEPGGGTGRFRPKNPFSRKARPVQPLESVEKLSPSFDETEVLDNMWTRSLLRGKRRRS